MDDERFFEEQMAQLGVLPIGKGRQPAPKPVTTRPKAQAVISQDESQLFLEAFSRLKSPHDKDTQPSVPPQSRSLKKAQDKARKLAIEESLDLHGLSAIEAERVLAARVSAAYLSGVKSLLVITGKGQNSPTGQSVLRPMVERWIQTKGVRFVEAFALAPRAFGGTGALILYIKRT